MNNASPFAGEIAGILGNFHLASFLFAMARVSDRAFRTSSLESISRWRGGEEGGYERGKEKQAREHHRVHTFAKRNIQKRKAREEQTNGSSAIGR